MCGRFAFLFPGDELAKLFGLDDPIDGAPTATPTETSNSAPKAALNSTDDLPLVAPAGLGPRYNIAPGQEVAAVVSHPGRTGQSGRRLASFRWGLVPSWAKDPKIGNRLINARSETVREKPSFRAAFRSRRCLIPASGFYEWRRAGGGKTPIYIQPTNAPLFAFAGLWETWRAPGSTERDLPALHTCTILTTSPNALMRPIHDRMPVILPPDRWTDWLDASRDPFNTAQVAAGAPSCFAPYPAEAMRAHEVSARVNSPRHDAPDCIQPHSQMELF